MAVISGVNSSSNAVAANQMPDIDRVLSRIEPYRTPFLQHLFFSSRRSKEVYNPNGKFSWFEDKFMPHQTTNKTAVTAMGTPATLTLTASNCNDLTIFNTDDIVLIEETDQMAYVSVKNTTQVVLNHIDGSSPLISLLSDGMFLKIVGSRNSEYATVRSSLRQAEVEVSNYLNIFSDSVASTGRYQAGKNWTDGVDHASLVVKKISEMKLQIERYFLFALNTGYATVGNYRTTYGHGFLGRVQSNRNAYTSSLDEVTLDSHFQDVFAQGSGHRIHMCGSGQLVELNTLVKAKYQLNPNPVATIYGVNVAQYITPFGLVDIVWNPVMDGKFANYGFTLDPAQVRLRYMAPDKKGSRRFRIEKDVETPGIDGTVDKILFDVGVEIKHEASHGILYRT